MGAPLEGPIIQVCAKFDMKSNLITTVLGLPLNRGELLRDQHGARFFEIFAVIRTSSTISERDVAMYCS